MSVKLDDTVCRVCLSSSGFIAIFDGCGKDDQFRYCTLLEASKDDGLPSKLCKKCNDHLKVAYDFRFQAIYAEKYFRKTIFLPSFKKEEDIGIVNDSDAKKDCVDELDENMAEIDMLLAMESEVVDAGEDDDDNINNSGFYDDESIEYDDKQVEIIGMETFEREQREQKVKLEIAASRPPIVSTVTTATENIPPCTVTISHQESLQPSLETNNNNQYSNNEINDLQEFTMHSPYNTQPVKDIRIENSAGSSLHLEINPVLKNDTSYDFNSGTSAEVGYRSFIEPSSMQYRDQMSMQLEYEQPQQSTTEHLSIEPLQQPVQPSENYDYAYQEQFTTYSTDTNGEDIQQNIQPDNLQETTKTNVTFEVPLAAEPKTESYENKKKEKGCSRKEKIECNICGNTFTHLNSLKTHLLKHSGEKPFKCEFCDKAFARKTVLNIHRRLHTGEKPYKCSLCSSGHVTKEALARHLQKDHEQEIGANFRKDKVSYICSICNKSRCSKYSLASHMKTHSSEGKIRRKFTRKKKEKSDVISTNLPATNILLKYSCKICQKGFPNKWELSTHAESHDMNKTFECDICQRTFEKKFQLLYHLQTHDGGEELVKAKVQLSSKKTEISNEEKDLKKTNQNEKKLKRKLRERKRRKRKTQLEHDESDDGEADDDNVENDKDCNKNNKTKTKATRAQRENLKVLRASSKIECLICEAVFTHPTSLKTHMLVHSGERPFKCDHCDKSFARKTVLNIHRRLHTGEKPYKCPLCDSACVTKDALMRHMSKDHDDDRDADRIKFTCGICHKAMRTKYSLQAHMKLHELNSATSEELKYSCNTCTESFDTKAEYTKHMDVHDSNRNFQCDICQVIFEKKFKLLFHLQTHKIEDLPCKKCGETFTVRENLIQHIKLQHMEPQNMDFQCPTCNIGQYDARDLKLHMSNAHEVVMGGLNSCDLCGESYSTAAEYYKHMHDKHDNISKTCKECEKYFDSRKAFDKHILTHYM